jgi:hypothetical protein
VPVTVKNSLGDGQTAAAANKQPKWVSKKKKAGAKKPKKKAPSAKIVVVKKPAASAAAPGDEKKEAAPAESATNHQSPAVETVSFLFVSILMPFDAVLHFIVILDHSELILIFVELLTAVKRQLLLKSAM